MKKITQILVSAGLLFFVFLLLQHPACSIQAIRDGLQVCSNSILPTLFPFFVLTELWVSLGYAGTMSRLLGSITERIFHLPGNAASALVLGAVGGYPIGTVTAVNLYEDGQLTKEEAEHCLFFCNNAGPAFIIGLVGGVVFQNMALGYILWAIHLFAALLLGFLFRPASKISKKSTYTSQTNSVSFLPALTEAIRRGGATAIQVCIFVLFFSVVTAQLGEYLPDTPAASLLLSSLELAGGISKLSALGLPIVVQLVLYSGLLGWGGLCVHCQSLSILARAKLRCSSYLLGKAAHCMVSTALACLAVPWVIKTVPCFAPAAGHGLLFLLPWLLFLLPMKTTTGKTEENPL